MNEKLYIESGFYRQYIDNLVSYIHSGLKFCNLPDTYFGDNLHKLSFDELCEIELNLSKIKFDMICKSSDLRYIFNGL